MPVTRRSARLKASPVAAPSPHPENWEGSEDDGTGPIYVSYDLSQAEIESTGFGGIHYRSQWDQYQHYTVDMLEEMLGFRKIKWDGKTYRPIVEVTSQKVIGALSGRPPSSWTTKPKRQWDDDVKAMNSLLDLGRMQMEGLLNSQQLKSIQSTRGNFVSLQFGYQHGGGSEKPCNCGSKYPRQAQAFTKRVQMSPEFCLAAKFISHELKATAPKLHTLCKENMLHVKRHYSDESGTSTLHEAFTGSVLPTGTCGIMALGSFDSTKGGHLVLWELKLVIEFPAGSTILIPSSIISHSNIPVASPSIEKRFSFTMYASGELFRLAVNGFRTHKQIWGQDVNKNPRKRVLVEQHYRGINFKEIGISKLKDYKKPLIELNGIEVIMSPSAAARLMHLEIESPWSFQLRNPSNPAASTHAGMLEFIAQEGVVHLPYWMMKTVRLNEGDPIRITGTELPKGKFVKLQAQPVLFLEISDPKAVLEQALRNLTQGNIIENSYNSMVFGLLAMETKPGGLGEGISVLDTDLEVDFAAPVGYVEPERPKPAAPATMASKLKIDLDSQSRESSRPGSALSGGFEGAPTGQQTISKDGDHWGETLAGRKTKGKGISHRKVEQVPEGSKIIRTDNRKIVTADIWDTRVKVPAALNLPFGRLFFGFNALQPSCTYNRFPRATFPTTDTALPPGPLLLKRLLQRAANLNRRKRTFQRICGVREVIPLARGLTALLVQEVRPTPDFGVSDDEIIDIDSD
ncbi:hypothetical protein NMY22_g14754 [Coprinellus aureogranulatus]|nr:hypothetical protein NMY22_g14754 [Coprinellus aureogranulatus]